MRQHLSFSRSFLSPNAAYGKCDGSRPCTAHQGEARKPGPADGSLLDTTFTAESIPLRRSSLTTSSGPTSNGYDIPHLTRTPWEVERYKRHSVWKRSAKLSTESQFSPLMFKKLPREVYDCVVEQLEQLHLGQDQPCPSCYLRDLFNLSLTSRAWDRAATLQMYCKIWVLGSEDHQKMPKLKITGTSRLKLLRRTLRERQTLARYVRELHMPDFQTLYHNATIEREEIINLVASLVMACPNLERLVGFHVPYDHSYDRLSYALSTRSKLKERVWYLTDNDIEADEDEEDPTRGYYHSACDPIEHFLELNSNHNGLTTLVLHQEAALPSTELTFRAIIGTLRQFPVLRHLSISGLSSTSFSNLALNALPPNLQSLRLEDLAGINDKGLQRFASSLLSTSLESIVLIDLEICNITTISTFLSPRLTKLKRFSLAQHRAPSLPSGADIPSLQSPSLSYIHWELRSQAGPPPTLKSYSTTPEKASFPFLNNEPISCLATSLLARSISQGSFLALRRIRAPHDPQGILQALCKPIASALLPSDASFFTTPPPRPLHPLSRSPSSDSDRASIYSLREFLTSTGPSSRIDSAMSSPMSGNFSIDQLKQASASAHGSLPAAITPARSRLAAQSRIIAARKDPFIGVKVYDPKGALRVDKTTSGFLGDLSSNVTYMLRPDRNRMDDGGAGYIDEESDESVNDWIVGIGDVMGEWEVVSGVEGRNGGCGHAAGKRGDARAVEVEDMF